MAISEFRNRPCAKSEDTSGQITPSQTNERKHNAPDQYAGCPLSEAVVAGFEAENDEGDKPEQSGQRHDAGEDQQHPCYRRANQLSIAQRVEEGLKNLEYLHSFLTFPAAAAFKLSGGLARVIEGGAQEGIADPLCANTSFTERRSPYR